MGFIKNSRSEVISVDQNLSKEVVQKVDAPKQVDDPKIEVNPESN